MAHVVARRLLVEALLRLSEHQVRRHEQVVGREIWRSRDESRRGLNVVTQALEHTGSSLAPFTHAWSIVSAYIHIYRHTRGRMEGSWQLAGMGVYLVGSARLANAVLGGTIAQTTDLTIDGGTSELDREPFEYHSILTYVVKNRNESVFSSMVFDSSVILVDRFTYRIACGSHSHTNKSRSATRITSTSMRTKRA